MSEVRIRIRRGLASEWTQENPTLGIGEVGFETDTEKQKIGNGSTAWNSLSYSTVSRIITSDENANSTFYPVFVSNIGNNEPRVKVTSTALTFNPSTSTLTAGTFSGNLSGNASTATTAGNVTGTVAIDNGGTGATTAANARTNLGATTIGGNLFTLTNPGAITFPRFNANNTVTARAAADFRTDIGAGTVTSVGGTGTVSGLTLTGTFTTSGNLTLGGTLSVTPSNFSSQTANTFLAAPNGTNGVPSFRVIEAADVPTLNQNTTGQAGSVAQFVTFNNGGAGAASGTTYNGSTARTISYNTIGAAASNQTMHIGTTAVAINRGSANLALTGILSIAMPGSTSGTVTLIPTAAAGTTTLTLPATTGTVALTSQLPTVNNGTLTISTSGTGLSGSGTFTANQSGNSTITITSNATNANTVNTIVARDASGNFSAGTITATLNGNATSANSADNALAAEIADVAVALQTGKQINGTSFDGTSNITTANWGTARNITIGSTTRSVNGSTTYSWSLSDIGAAAVDQTIFIGTTPIEIDRPSGAQTLNGVSIDGSAATAGTATNLSRSVLAGNGLTGGGQLNANVTLTVGQGDGISVSSTTVAVDSTVVRTSGNQTISGLKVFSGNIDLASLSTSKAAGYLYSGTTNPTNGTRTNYDGHFYATQLHSGGSFVFSDRALKADIADWDGANLIKSLIPKMWKWKHDNSDGIGFVAQEVPQEFKGPDGLSIDYAKITAALVSLVLKLEAKLEGK